MLIIVDLPSSEQMNHRVPLAHYLARSAKQRTWGLRQRLKRGLGSRPLPLFSVSAVMFTSVDKRCR